MLDNNKGEGRWALTPIALVAFLLLLSWPPLTSGVAPSRSSPSADFALSGAGTHRAPGSVTPDRLTAATGSAVPIPAGGREAGATRAAEAPTPSSQVNPFLGHSTEPAPMGIADFGVSGSGGGSSAYEYATTTFQASAQVDSMHISATSGSTTVKVAAFELNAVLVLQLGGVNYSYWIQNGLHLDSTTDRYTIGGAYVWNFSSPTARLGSSELRGNSSSVLLTDTYYFVPSCGSFPGDCSPLTLPANLTARIALSTCGPYPCVAYEYDVGAGWVTYDSVSFLHMVGATPVGFVVDGHQYTPLGTGTFYDAEWDWVAAGGGLSGRDDGSEIEMALDFWNGHNYQAVPSAWNFGGDTGENSFNVTDSPLASGGGGAPRANLTSGPGTLGVLYNGSSVGFLNVTTPTLAPATLKVDGVAVSLRGGSANLTLGGGAHAVSLLNYSNASLPATVLPGQTTALNFSGAGRTAFEKSGLPAATVWGVTVDNLTHTGPSSLLTFNLPNGTYAVWYAKVPGYVENASNPTMLKVPALSPIPVGWSPYTFAVPVDESGLPNGTAWWVNVSGSVVEGASTTLFVTVPNGTTNFSVGSAYEFVASPPAGTIVVSAGRFSPVEVQFSYRPAFIAGTVSPSDANVTVGGFPQVVLAGTFNASVIPGAYQIIASAPGFVTQTYEVNATPGNVTVQSVSLSPLTAPPSSVPTSNPPPGPEPWLVLGAALVVVGAASGILLWRRSRNA
ncbi:MAG: thermopsin family protease [Thermoplasmata archaeon]|nr:thermopsin family protease [Thermoplasmata archaeon]